METATRGARREVVPGRAKPTNASGFYVEVLVGSERLPSKRPKLAELRAKTVVIVDLYESDGVTLRAAWTRKIRTFQAEHAERFALTTDQVESITSWESGLMLDVSTYVA